jgi:hypothetical protein
MIAHKNNKGKDGNPAMKKNGIFSAKSVVTLFSVLSVVLMFSLVCTGVLFLLNQMDIVHFPQAEMHPSAAPKVDGDIALPYHERETQKTEPLSVGVAAYEKLLAAAPFVESFYLKVRVDHIGEGQPDSGIYEIWRYGEKYRINRYNTQDEVEYMMTCDGERVQLVDFGTLSDSYYLMNDQYLFENVVPLPNFRMLLQEEYEIFEYTEAGGLCIVACEYPALSMVDETKLDRESGMLVAYKCIRKGQLDLSIQTLTSDTDFVFSDRMFEIYY